MLSTWNFRVAVGNSMLPFVKPADLIAYLPSDVKSLRKGDLVIYNYPRFSSNVILHRVIVKPKESRFVLAKGDNGVSVQKVFDFNLIGKVEAIKRGAKFYKLNAALHRFSSRFIAFFSSFNCTPYLLKRKFFDPLALLVAGNLGFISFPFLNLFSFNFLIFKLNYPDYFENAVRIKVQLGNVRCASLDLFFMSQGKVKNIIACNFYIRHLCRNKIITDNLICKFEEIIVKDKPENLFLVLNEDCFAYKNVFLKLGYVRAELPIWAKNLIFINPVNTVLNKQYG